MNPLEHSRKNHANISLGGESIDSAYMDLALKVPEHSTKNHADMALGGEDLSPEQIEMIQKEATQQNLIDPKKPIEHLPIPKDLSDFLEETGRKGIVDEDGFENVHGQKRAMVRYDETDRPVIYAAHTAAGKTYAALGTVAKALQDPSKKVLFITTQIKLVDQVNNDAAIALTLKEAERAKCSSEVAPNERLNIYNQNDLRLLVATGDIIAIDGKIPKEGEAPSEGDALVNLSDFAITVVDEIHNTGTKNAYARILKHIRDHNIPTRVLGLSATPAETEEELDRLFETIGNNPDLIIINTKKGKKDFEPHYLALPDIILEPAQLLEEAILDCQERIKEELGPHIESISEIKELVTVNGRYIRVRGENITSALAKNLPIQSLNSTKRRDISDDLRLLGAFGRYHRYLTGTGRFFFLDRLCRDSGNNWLFNVMHRNERLHEYRDLLRMAYMEVAKDTQYADYYGVPLSNKVYTALRQNLSSKEFWYDHPLTEKILELMREHLKERKPGNSIVESRYFEDAAYLSEVIERRLIDQLVEARTAAGSKYMTHSNAQTNIEEFARGQYRIMATTDFFGEGHSIKNALVLYLKSLPSTATKLTQFMGRVGREKAGLIHVLLTPYIAGQFDTLQKKKRDAELMLLRRGRI